MTRRYSHLTAVAILIAACSASCSAEQATLEEPRARAEQGDARAQFDLGVMYYDGRGVPQDYAEAVRWYRLAAEQGHAEGQFNLGRRYANGEGVPQDEVTAHMWINLAASRFTDERRDTAVQVRDEVAKRLTASQRAEAQRLAREWDAAHPRD